MSAHYGDQFDSDGWPIPSSFFEQVDEIACWICDELRARGVKVHQAKEKFGQVRIYLALPAEHRQIYREVCLEAIRMWPEYAKYIIFGVSSNHLLGPILGERGPSWKMLEITEEKDSG